LIYELLEGGDADPAKGGRDFHIGDVASVWKPTPTFCLPSS
jgi:hypothetical protein